MAQSEFKLPSRLEGILGILSKIYQKNQDNEKLGIIVNANIVVHEGAEHDNWDGGVDGHGVTFSVPEQLYLEVYDSKGRLQEELQRDLNAHHSISGEYFGAVAIEVGELAAGGDWRAQSGRLISRKEVAPEDGFRIWKAEGFRLFLSHKSEVKDKVAALKDDLAIYGIVGFVAHEDIHPTKEWQAEIETALMSMDGFIALMTPDFHDSSWTDQEVGFAVSRGVPIIAARLGLDPYGFIGKFQGLPATWESAAVEIARLLVSYPKMLEYYIQALEKCSNWDNANRLARLLDAIDHVDAKTADRIAAAYNSNSELRGGFGFNGSRLGVYGPGLLAHLNRWSNGGFIKTDESREGVLIRF
jgi:hypothetical protein